ncbi:MAG: hypothetical protein D6767_03460 [Candidatus Hydrogenedentota bacterium]|nr:MAG: hypothetical protein D6767_03460 [Candidatus Hydrogenedentota bacterium]
MNWFHEARKKYAHPTSHELREYAENCPERNNEKLEKHLAECRKCHEDFMGYLEAAYYEKEGKPPMKRFHTTVSR